MTKDHRLQSLARLTALRERQVESLSADMAARHAVRRRYMGNIERLEKLCQSTGPSAAAKSAPALSMNCASYKQAVMKMTDAHRVDLSLHEADMEVAGRTLSTAIRRHEALGHELGRARAEACRYRTKREQNLQDESAAQMWMRCRK